MERCTGKITDWLIKCGAIPETDRELYEYAIYSILLSLSPMLLALAIVLYSCSLDCWLVIYGDQLKKMTKRLRNCN